MRYIFFLAIFFMLASCASRQPAKVDEIGTKVPRSKSSIYARHSRNKQTTAKTHRVVKGDSLYSIGFKYQVDYKTLAKINNIKPPYRIYPNQVLQLSADRMPKVFSPSKQTQAQTTVRTKPLNNSSKINARVEKTNDNPIIKTPSTANTTPKSQPVKPKNQTATRQTKPKASTPIKTPTKTNLDWLWPTQGKIRTTFLSSNPARKGISIGGKEGQPVKAAEAGVVVYSGNGLLGYGELVIIKHNDTYLSAYGHNRTLKVKEGETVSRGQIIAELGSSGTNVNNLHFEIRKNGQPVNPLNYVKP